MDAHLTMAASEAWKPRGQQGRTECWMVSFSSSDMDVHIANFSISVRKNYFKWPINTLMSRFKRNGFT